MLYVLRTSCSMLLIRLIRQIASLGVQFASNAPKGSEKYAMNQFVPWKQRVDSQRGRVIGEHATIIRTLSHEQITE